MPFLHRWLGNPAFSLMTRVMFKVPVHDVYCGLRAFSKELYLRLDQQCTGMEFATEMIIKAGMFNARIAELPITLHKDGRTIREPHLRTVRDGWRTLRFFLMLSPRWLFLYPGAVLIGLGLLGAAIAFPGVVIQGVHFDVHTLLFAALALLLGYQSILFSLFAKTFAVSERLLPPSPWLDWFFKVMNLERALVLGALSMVAGVALLLGAWNQWRLTHFGPLDYPHTMRWVIPGMTLTALGFQTILSGFFVSILGMRRK